jgi:RNA polymerase sigma-70 factor, ECF subfamily
MATVAQPVQTCFRNPKTGCTVESVATVATSLSAADEAALARRAAAGDGEAFATLYERYAGRTLNLCYRILGSRDDAADATQEAFVSVLRRLPKLEGRDLAFGSYVFTSARNACYDLIERRKRTEPSDDIPEHATPVGGGGTGADPGDPEDDPERNVLLEARTEEIRAANLTLPERQREVLALKELEELSYDEIAEIMGMNRNSVAQLISRARINLRDALRGSALVAIAPASPECERATPLISSAQDGQLDSDSADAEWLADHLITCEVCRARREAMEEAGVSYRAWLPIAAGPLLFRETMAQAAELVGADWSDVIARHESRTAAGGAGTGVLRHRRLDLVLVGLLALALVLVVFVGPTTDSNPLEAIVPAAEEQPAAADEGQAGGEPAKQRSEAKKAKTKNAGAERPEAPPSSAQTGGAPQDASASTGGSTGAGAGGGTPQPRDGGDIDRNRNGSREGGLTGDPTPQDTPPAEVAPDPTPPPPPDTDTTPTDPPACRDASGVPIPCGTPPTRTPPPRITPPSSPRNP